ncbi:MAG: hypothetical protein K0S80_4412 [Neobacillus sp.]|nr:hypothetical protein [Neobacillus sp.]
MAKNKKLVYIGKEERIIPQFGQFKPGDEVDFNESLLSTGLFKEKNEKDGEK